MMRNLIFGLIFLATSFVLTAQEGFPRMLPGEVNSSASEWAPIASPEGSALYFTRLGHPQNMGNGDAADIWITYRYSNGQWPRAVNAGAPLNSRQDERVVGIHASGQRLYLYHPNEHTLFYSDRHGRTWKPPVPIAIDSFNLKGKDARYAFSPSGGVLLLSFAGKGSMGGRDIYICFASSDNRYSFPQPLGPPANSSADEVGLWLAADGETLYFSSDRAGGLGGQDFYFIRRLDGGWNRWTLPKNLGTAVNTSEDDLFLSMPASGFPVYFLRSNEGSATDIYESKLPDSLLPRPLVLLTGTIRDAASGQAINAAKAQLQPIDATPFLPIHTDIPDDDERFQFILPHGQDVELTATINGHFFPVSQPLELSGQALKELDYDSAPLLASLYRDPAYVQRNTDIVTLQSNLRKMDEALIQLQEQREALRQKMIGRRKADSNWTPSSDPELDAIRHRYQQYKATATVQDTIIPDSYDAPADDIRELEDMKERYNRYKNYQEKQQEQVAEAAERNTYVWEENKEFENLEEEIWHNLEESLVPEVEQELSLSMLETVKREVGPSLTEQEQQQLALKEDALRRKIRQSFSPPAGNPDDWAARGQTAETDWERQLKDDIQAAIEPRVKEELLLELEDDIKAALTNDITYWAKKETQVDLQAELNEKLQQQIEFEKRKAAAVPATADAVTPLEPVSPPKTVAYQEIKHDLLLVRAEPGAVILLNTVVFEPNKPTLKPAAYAELGRVLEFLAQNEQFIVEIGVHTRRQFSHNNALSLTTQRARAIANYLVENGIDPARVIPKGYGKAFPVVEEDSPEAQRRNQRVEMRILTSTH